ncbi:hypothetical protein MRB53_041887 [Persea americana]|nr:hypothetical protein MRB53_041887 [Persea americana]
MIELSTWEFNVEVEKSCPLSQLSLEKCAGSVQHWMKAEISGYLLVSKCKHAHCIDGAFGTLWRRAGVDIGSWSSNVRQTVFAIRRGVGAGEFRDFVPAGRIRSRYCGRRSFDRFLSLQKCYSRLPVRGVVFPRHRIGAVSHAVPCKTSARITTSRRSRTQMVPRPASGIRSEAAKSASLYLFTVSSQHWLVRLLPSLLWAKLLPNVLVVKMRRCHWQHWSSMRITRDLQYCTVLGTCMLGARLYLPFVVRPVNVLLLARYCYDLHNVRHRQSGITYGLAQHVCMYGSSCVYVWKKHSSLHSPASDSHWLLSIFWSTSQIINRIVYISRYILEQDPKSSKSESIIQIYSYRYNVPMIQGGFGSSYERSTLS